MKLTHKFVKNVPDKLEDGIIYISLDYNMAIHKCCSGCGMEVATPLSPTDWKLIYDGETISLYPSIGNWSLPCRSHYWITKDEVKWAPKWSRKQVKEGREEEVLDKDEYYKKRKKRKAWFDFFT